MIPNLLIILIIIIILIFYIYRRNTNTKENFQTTPPPINEDCYNTEIDNCTQDKCNIKSKISSSKCFNKTKCSDTTVEGDCNNIDGCSYLTNLTSSCEGKEEGDCDNNICVWNSLSNKCFEKDSNYEVTFNCGQYGNEDQCNSQEMCSYVTSDWGDYCNSFMNVNEKASNIPYSYTQTNSDGDCTNSHSFKLIQTYNWGDMEQCFNDNQICSYKTESGSTNNITDSVRNDNCFLMEADNNKFMLSSTGGAGDSQNNSVNYYTHTNLRDTTRLKHFACSEIQRLYNHSKSLLPSYSPGDSVDTDNEQKVTASKIIDYIENYTGNPNTNAIFGTGNDKKCKISDDCKNICKNLNKNMCSNNDQCHWVSDGNPPHCVRKLDWGTDSSPGCAQSENCSINDSNGDNICDEEIDYQYRFCSPKIDCEDNEYITVDSDKNLICSKCPAGTYLNSNGVCRNCEFGKYSNEGATQCSDKADCASSQYVSGPTNPINLSYLSASQRRKLEFASSVYRDSINISSNRECVDLEKCDNKQFLTDLDSTATENNQYNYLQNVDKAIKRNKYLKENVGSDHCNEFNPTPTPEVYSNTPVRFNQYSCSDLTKCNKNQYISNYNDHKVKTSNMYTINRDCSDSTDCKEGTYEEERVSDDYPEVEIQKGEEKYNVYTRDRNCLSCDDNHYSNVPNMTACVLQPTCDKGKIVNLTLNDFILANIHELVFDGSNSSNVKFILRKGGVPENHLTTLTGTSFDVFFHTETDTSGVIKYINEDSQIDVSIFNYSVVGNQILLEHNHESITVNKSELNTSTFVIDIEVTDTAMSATFNISLRMKHNIPKNRMLDCIDCGKYSYMSDETHRNIACLSQPECNLGYKYPGDPTGLDSKVSCQECPLNTYIGPPDENGLHRREKCIDQPILQKGQCSVNYTPDYRIARMTIKDADGDETYQDEDDHRNPCLTHKKCEKGEKISPIDRNAPRNCIELNQHPDTLLKDVFYIDKNNHRITAPVQNQECSDSSNIHYINAVDDIRARYKKQAECITAECALIKQISPGGVCPI